MTEQPLRHHNNLHSCKAIVDGNVRSFKLDDTLQRKTLQRFASLRVSNKAILTASIETRREAFFCP